MCQVIIHKGSDGVERRMDYHQPNPSLPVISIKGETRWLPWGRKPMDVSSQLPPGGWARLTDIKGGVWDRFHPKPVRLAIASFMQTDILGNAEWYLVMAGQYIQGLLATNDQEQRVYIVTLEPKGDYTQYERWPRIITNYRYSHG